MSPFNTTSLVRAVSPSPEVPALDNTLGALLTGTCVGLVYVFQYLGVNTMLTYALFVSLYGLILHQTYRYFRLYPDDRFLIRVFVSSFTFMFLLYYLLRQSQVWTTL